jgi:hypothetical protein
MDSEANKLFRFKTYVHSGLPPFFLPRQKPKTQPKNFAIGRPPYGHIFSLLPTPKYFSNIFTTPYLSPKSQSHFQNSAERDHVSKIPPPQRHLQIISPLFSLLQIHPHHDSLAPVPCQRKYLSFPESLAPPHSSSEGNLKSEPKEKTI